MKIKRFEDIATYELDCSINPLEIIRYACDGARHDFFLLESALRSGAYSNYSFFGFDPFLKLKSTGRHLVIEDSNGVTEKEGDPFEQLNYLLRTYKSGLSSDPGRDVMVPFTGGAVGYLSYDMCRLIEKIPESVGNDSPFPDMYFGFYDTFVAIDHAAGRSYVVSSRRGSVDGGAGTKMDELVAAVKNAGSACGCGRDGQAKSASDNSTGTDNRALDGLAARQDISGFFEANYVSGYNNRNGVVGDGKFISNFSRDEYIDAVRVAQEYIMAGDIYQVNLSQRFQTRTDISPFKLYERLTSINPAPYSSFIGFDGLYTISSSPERFLSVDSTENISDRKKSARAQTRPIKGTRPRCANSDDDRRAQCELLASPKDDAELTMIVDLVRNDLGRVCDFGSVEVVERKTLESFATVHHLVSTVEGDLGKGCHAIDLIKAMFPGGSITGAPKIRAMEIIDELEPTKRSVYTGAIGYIGFDGNMDLSMAIRTLLMNGDNVSFQVGGAVVADSDPFAEYDETLHKAIAMVNAIVGR